MGSVNTKVSRAPGSLDSSEIATMRGMVSRAWITFASTSPLSSWISALYAAQAGGRLARILCIGDSVTEGARIPTPDRRWVRRLVSGLRRRYSIAGNGIGYVPSYHLGGTVSDGWVISGSVVQQAGMGLGQRNVYISGGGSQTATFNCTGFDVICTKYNGGGTITVSVDGGAAQTASTNAAPTAVSQVLISVRGLSSGPHEITIGNSGNMVNFEGLVLYDGDESSGVIVYEAGRSGATSSTHSGAPNIQGAIAMAAPDLTIVMLGLNDQNANVTPAAYASNIEALCVKIAAAAPTSSVLFVSPYSYRSTSTYTAEQYAAAVAPVVSARGYGYIDLSAILPGYAAAPSYMQRLYDADTIHLSESGGCWLTGLLLSSIAPPGSA